MSTSIKDFVIGAAAITGGLIIGVGSGGLAGALATSLVAYGSQRVIDGVSKLRNSAEQRIEGSKLNVTSTQAPIPVIYGKQRVGMQVADTRVVVKGTDHGGSSSVTPAAVPNTIFTGAEDDDIMVRVGSFALASENGSGIQAITNIRMYDDGVDCITGATSFSAAPSNTGVITKYNGELKYTLEDGDNSQGIQTVLGNALGWDTTAKGVGVAYGAFYCLYDEEVWHQGMPSITAEVTGNRVYDPRNTSSGPNSDGWINYAASGISSDNPALCILDYLTSKRYGCAVPYAARDGGTEDFIDEASFETAADYCDYSVSVPGGGSEKRFRMNAVIHTGRITGANLTEMLATCRGSLIFQNGKYRLVINGTASAQSFELTEDNIVGEINWSRLGANIPNRIEATFPDSVDGEYVANSVVWPLADDDTYLDEDNGVENRVEIELPYTTGYYQALRTAMVMLKEARNDVVAEIVATQAAYQLQVGEVVKVTHEGPGWDELLMRVNAVSLTPDGLVRLVVQQYTAAAYTVDTLDAQPSAPTTALPNETRSTNQLVINEDRYVSQGAVSAALATQSWHRRISVRTGATCRNLRVVYSFTRPATSVASADAISRDYNFDVAANSSVTFNLKESAGGSTQTFFGVGDGGTTKYDPAFSVTITPSDATGGSGKVGTPQVTDSRGIETEDDVGVRLDAEISDPFIENADTRVAFVNFTSSADFIAQQFEVTGGDKNIRSIIVRLMGNGSPGGPMRPYIYSNTAGSPDVPNAQLKLGLSIDADTITTTGTGEDVEFLFDDYTLANGYYWFVLETSPTVSDYIKIGVDDGSPDFGRPTASSTDLGSWTAITGKSLCRFAVTKTAFQKVPARDLTTMAGLKAEWIPSDGRVSLKVEPGYVSGSGGDITGITAGTGLSGGGTSGDVTLNVEASQTQITSLGTIGTGTWNATAIGVAKGGTGLTSYTSGDVLYASGTTTLAKLAKGSDGQVLTLASGVPSWATPTTGDITSVVAGTGLSGGGTSSDVTLAVKYAASSNLVDGASDSGDIVSADLLLYRRDSDGVVYKDTVGALPFTNTAGTVTSVTAGTGLSSSGTATVNPTLAVDLDQLSDGGTLVGTDSLVAVNGTASELQEIQNIPLSIFSNDSGFITSGLTGANGGLTTSGSNAQVKYSSGSNLVDEAASGTAATADLILFRDDNDSGIIKKDSIADVLDLVTASNVTAGTFSGAFTFNDTLTVNKGSNNTIIKLGGSPSNNWAGHILLNTSNSVINWRLASNQDVAGAFTITPSTAAGGETYTTPHFVIKAHATAGYNVGIGNTAPGHRLVVDNGGNSSDYTYVQIKGYGQSLYLGHDSSGATIYSTGAVPMYFLTNSSTRMTLDSGGNLGLGETSPDCIFHIKGATTIKARIKLEQTTAGLNGTIQQGSSGFAIAGNGAQSILLETNGVTRMKVGSTGQVFVTGNQAYVQHGTNHSNSATVSIDFNTGNQQAILYNSTRSSQTINLDGMEPGGSYVVLMQHTSGTPPTSITWSPQAGTLIWVNGNDPVIAASGSGDCTVVQFLYLSSAGGMTPVVIGSWYQAI